MSALLHAIALILWMGAMFFAVGLGAVISGTAPDRKTAMIVSMFVGAFFVMAFALQVIA